MNASVFPNIVLAGLGHICLDVRASDRTVVAIQAIVFRSLEVKKTLMAACRMRPVAALAAVIRHCAVLASFEVRVSGAGLRCGRTLMT